VCKYVHRCVRVRRERGKECEWRLLKERLCVCENERVCVCTKEMEKVCVREIEREREGKVPECVCVCEREREREKEKSVCE